MHLHILLDTVHDLHGHHRICKICSSDADSRSSCQNQFQRIFCILDAAQSDDAHATAGELQSIAAGPRPVAGLDVLIELANAADELEQKGEGVLGHGVIAIMFGVADADLQLARLIEIEVAGDAGTRYT